MQRADLAYAFHLHDVAHAVVVLRLAETRAGQSFACDDEGLRQKGWQRFYSWKMAAGVAIQHKNAVEDSLNKNCCQLL